MSESITKNVSIDLVLRSQHLVGTVDVLVNEEEHYYEVMMDTFESNINELADLEMHYTVYYEDYEVASVRRLVRYEALHQAGDTESVGLCEVSGYWVRTSDLITLGDGRTCYDNFARYFDVWGEYVLRDSLVENVVRDAERGRHYYTAPQEYFDNDMYYCEECDSYVLREDWDGYEDTCCFCAGEHEDKIIDDYCESHRREVIYFDGDCSEQWNEDNFEGLGFELEVDCEAQVSRKNNATARELCSVAGLEENEMRYAHDGSLNYGFECISQPHTIKDFWLKQDKWTKMLKYLVAEGYRSHDTNTCGLHVHVSRRMFGKTKEMQDEAISKVYTFFDNNWEDLIKVSRRRNFTYCDKNRLDEYGESRVRHAKSTRLSEWRNKSKIETGHYVALNNGNRHTFEYRLGRGTLNPWSFFSWIDLIVTITKNAKRITVGKVNTNDLVSWLGGIKETTAKYIYQRGAFKSTMLALYPSIGWEFSNDDNDNDDSDSE